MDHPTRVCLAEVVVTGPDGKPSRGSGYRVAGGWVLTAAHVVKGAVSIGVWFGAPRTLDPALGAGIDPSKVLRLDDLDLALLPVPPGSAPTGFVPPPFGRLDRDSATPVPLVAVGFPWFKLTTDPDDPKVEVRESHTATGLVVGLSDARLGTLEWRLLDGAPPGPHPDPKRSAWEGMSGAGVFTAPGGVLVGVVGQHAPGRDPGTLTVRPLQTGEGAEPASVRSDSRWVDALPQLVAELPSVTPPTARALSDRRAQRAAGELVPEVLLGRDSDLARLSEFTGSGQRWRWIRAEAFAGKTALLAWFALHPPENVDVMACFLQQTLNETTASHALQSLTRQLAGHLNRAGYQPPQAMADLISDFLDDLLPQAAERAVEQQRRLVLIVDGIDEYAPLALEPRNLDQWLPDQKTLPDGAALIVSSRQGIPVRLADTHPLWTAIDTITASQAAAAIRKEALDELAHASTRSTGDPLLRFRIGACLAACGGQITETDLTTWLSRSGEPVLPGDLKNCLALWYRHTIRTTLADDTPTLAFAHQTLSDLATHDTFAAALPALRNELHTWADEFAEAGWPTSAPSYFYIIYPQLLAGLQDTERLVTLALDPNRRSTLFVLTGAHAAALDEIRAAMYALDSQGLDPVRMSLLAITRDDLAKRAAMIPWNLPALYAAGGDYTRALELARGNPDPWFQAAP